MRSMSRMPKVGARLGKGLGAYMETLPGGLGMGAEDALVGSRRANRRRTTRGVLGGKALSGGLGSRGMGLGRLKGF